MPLNDYEDAEFDSHIDDESTSPMPATEIGKIRVHRGRPEYWDNEMSDLEEDYGSGSMAEHSAIMPGDGRLEVAEDKVMLASDMEIGYSNGGRENIEIGEAGIDYGRYGIGEAGVDHGRYGIGEQGIGEQGIDEGRYGMGELQAPFESFMLGPNRMGDVNTMEHPLLGEHGTYFDERHEMFHSEHRPHGGDVRLVGEHGIDEGRYGQYVGVAVTKVVEKARDNRLPPPPMRATDIAEDSDDDDWDLTQTMVGAAAASGNPDPFPLTSQFMLRCGAGMEPRFVRVDTEESYKAFRAEQSPEMAELHAKVAELHDKVDAHINDADAHGGHGDDTSGMVEADLEDDIEDIALLGAEVQAAEHDKRIELWMPKRFDGKVEAWREGDFVCASIVINDGAGEVKICTSLEPIRKCVDEMVAHAANAGVTSEVVGVLPAMGCVLGAGTAIKEMAAGAKDIAEKAVGKPGGWCCKIEPKMNPALCALAMLAMACRAGNQQACQEWSNLAALSPAPVKQAMIEALQIAKASE